MSQSVYLVPLLPLAGFLINGLLRKSLSKQAVSIIGCGVILIAFLISLGLFFQLKANGPIIQTYFNFIDI
jgi:NADH-quinone oxidoreductase subunit L